MKAMEDPQRRKESEDHLYQLKNQKLFKKNTACLQ